MSMAKRTDGNRPLNAILIDPARRLCERMIDLRRRGVRRHSGAQRLAQLDDHLLRDIGLTRSQAHAAAYGLLNLGERSASGQSEESPLEGAGNVVPLTRRAIAMRVDQATSAPLVRRAANG
jgi:uncharacterized protein YjiS (DUF1127 family)